MQRVLTWVGKSLLLLVLSIAVLGGSRAYAANSCGPDATWSFNSANGELKISGSGKTTSSPWIYSHRQNIKSVSIAKTITGLSPRSFSGCTNLKSVYIHKELTDAMRCFENSGISSITFESGIKEIPTSIFADLKLLKTVQIPDSVTKINTSAFENCTGLTTVKLPSKLQNIGSSAFAKCSSLKNITIPNTVTMVFSSFDKSGLETATLQAGIKKVPGTLFSGCSKLKNISIPDSVTVIEHAAFRDCVSLTSLKLPSNLKQMHSEILGGTIGLKSLTIPKTVTYAISAFQNSSLTKVVLQNGMKEIPSYLFKNNKTLTSVDIPGSITKINLGAFEECSELKVITIPASVSKIDNTAFNKSGLQTIYGVYNSYAHTFAKQKGYRFIANGKAMQFLSISTIRTQKHTGKALTPAVTVKDGTKTLKAGQDYSVSYRNNTKVGTATVTIRGIGSYYSGTRTATFAIAAKKGKTYTNGSLKYKVLSDSTNGKGTVSVAGLSRNVRSITIPKSVRLGSFKYKITAIESRAFYKKSRLKTIKIKSTDIKKMGSGAFSRINKRATITIPRSKRSSYKRLLKRAGVSRTVRIK